MKADVIKGVRQLATLPDVMRVIKPEDDAGNGQENSQNIAHNLSERQQFNPRRLPHPVPCQTRSSMSMNSYPASRIIRHMSRILSAYSGW